MPRPVSSTFHEKLLRCAFQQILRNAAFYISMLTWIAVGVIVVLYGSFLGYLGFGQLFITELTNSAGGFRGLAETINEMITHLPPVPSILAVLMVGALAVAAVMSRLFIERSIQSLEDESEEVGILNLENERSYLTVPIRDDEA